MSCTDTGNTKFSIGQDSHAFEEQTEKPLILGGVFFDGYPGMKANSDGDVVLHALTNAVSGITCRNILGSIADKMCKSGITDSAEYLKVALDDLKSLGMEIVHVSFTMECLRPKISPKVQEMRESIAALLGITPDCVGITATTGEGLTAFGKGEGIMVFCVLSCRCSKKGQAHT